MFLGMSSFLLNISLLTLVLKSALTYLYQTPTLERKRSIGIGKSNFIVWR